MVCLAERVSLKMVVCCADIRSNQEVGAVHNSWRLILGGIRMQLPLSLYCGVSPFNSPRSTSDSLWSCWGVVGSEAPRRFVVEFVVRFLLEPEYCFAFTLDEQP